MGRLSLLFVVSLSLSLIYESKHQLYSSEIINVYVLCIRKFACAMSTILTSCLYAQVCVSCPSVR
uniref:Secreted protein n=1 Tax=Ascaris lumbricoides TaxID=6252 RepID=A0A0M3IBK4_ASCLU